MDRSKRTIEGKRGLMRIRKLNYNDALRMHEWMRDELVVGYLDKDFRSMTIDDCIHFIDMAQNTNGDIHLAVTDKNDIYQGTVSLKNIKGTTAEFGIVMCRDAHGTGMAADAMRTVLRMGFEEVGLKTVYWYLRPNNRRASAFYDKNGYQITVINKHKEVIDAIMNGGMSVEEISNYIWYIQQRTQ